MYIKKPPHLFGAVVFLVVIGSGYDICTRVAYILNNNVTYSERVLGNNGIDRRHNLKHLALWDSSIGFYRNNIATLTSDGGGNCSLGICAFVVGIAYASLAEVALYGNGRAIVIKSDLHLTATGANYTG